MTGQQRRTLYLTLAVVGGLFVVCGGLVMAAVLATKGDWKIGDSAAQLPGSNNRTYEGRSADEWGPGLLDTDSSTSESAAVALSNLGDDGLRWFRRGFESDIRHVRWHSLRGLAIKDAARFKGEFEPILLRLLDDTDREHVTHAALFLSGMKSAKGKDAFAKRRGLYPRDSDQAEFNRILAKWGQTN